MNNARRKAINSLVAKLNDLRTKIDDLSSELEIIANEEQEAYDNMPDSLRESERGEAVCQCASNLADAFSNIDSLGSNVDDLVDLLECVES